MSRLQNVAVNNFMKNNEVDIKKLRDFLLIGGSLTIIFVFLLIFFMGERTPFSILIPVLTVLWVVGFILNIKYLVLMVKNWFK
jgi:hypothetical protein